MKKVIYILTIVMILSLTYKSNIGAEPSKNIRLIIADSVSMMDFFCYQLEMRLHEHYKLNYDVFSIFEEFHKIAEKIEDKKLIAQYESILNRKIKYAEYIYFNVYFDFSANRLNVDCNSHSYSKKNSKQFKRYWEGPKPFDNWAHYIKMFKSKGYNVGKTNEIREKIRPKGIFFPISSRML